MSLSPDEKLRNRFLKPLGAADFLPLFASLPGAGFCRLQDLPSARP
uniref:Uncharacterized protein n=1 Tax=mine drainage metagenome TaxID=410659 RepID=E6QJA0_9ZZZZ